MGFVPEIGMKGMVEVRAPFDAVIDPYAFYECIGLETLSGMLANGEAPYEAFYDPVGLSQADMLADQASGAKMVTLQCVSGEIVVVPSPYIVTIPDANGVRYHTVMLGVALSVLPDTQDLAAIKADVAGLIEARLGVKSKIEEVVYGPTSLVAYATHQELQLVRRARMVESQADAVLVKQYKEEVQAMRQKIELLEHYVAQHLQSSP